MGYIALLFLLGTMGILLYLSSMREVFLRRVVSVFAFSIGLFLFISCASFSKGSPSGNLGGVVGYWAAYFLTENLGYLPSFGLSFLLLVFSFLFFGGRWSRERAIKSGFLILALLFLSAQIGVFITDLHWLGRLNLSLSEVLSKYLSVYGATLLLLTLIVISLLPFVFPMGRIRSSFRSLFPLRGEVKTPLLGKRTRPSRAEGQRERPKKPRSLEGYFPSSPPSQEALVALLDEPPSDDGIDRSECEAKAKSIEEKLREFEVEGKIAGYHPGPVVTRFEFEPAPGVKLSKILSLSDDLAMRMRAHKIRIEAPLPGRGLIGIEVPNERRRVVTFREMVDKEAFRSLDSNLAFALGVDTAGHPVYGDLAKMPHLLIAGATGSGKSVCINTLIASILFRSAPKDVRFLLIDPKRVELTYYEGIPHLLRPVVLSPRGAVYSLKEAVGWMEERYRHFSKDGVRDIESHNATLRRRGEKEPLPYIVIIIDEFGDLITTMSRDVEEPLARLAQMARAVGIHLVVATQRPSVKVITGTIKTNFPVRIAFKVPSRTDSRVILDEIGAEKLLGRGDMLFIPPGSAELKRLHGALITEDEIKRIAKNLTASYLEERLTTAIPGAPGIGEVVDYLVESDEVPPLARRDLPGYEERFERIVGFLSSRLHLPMEDIRPILEELRESYYPPVLDISVRLPEVQEEIEREEDVTLPEGWDPLLPSAARLIVAMRIASATLLQRKMKIGFARAARILDQLEEIGIVGPPEGSKPRDVLVGPETLEEKLKGLEPH